MFWKKDVEFETERLIVRQTNEGDAEFIFELLNSPKWIQFIGDRNVNSKAEAKTYIKEKMLPQMAKLGFGNYTVIRKQDQERIGTCGLFDREGIDGIDIGFAFLPEFEHQGFAFESASKLMDVAKSKFNIKTLSAITLKENNSSQKLLEKLGLKQIGTTRIPNDSEELLLYRIEF